VPTYRVYFAEREPGGSAGSSPLLHEHNRVMYGPNREVFSETEWEEEVEARSPVAALEAFFREHARSSNDLRWVDEAGDSQEVAGLDYDPDKTYIWIENDKLMEYQGIDEATAGKVSCPLCEGNGEVDPEVADEYLAIWEPEEGATEGSWG